MTPPKPPSGERQLLPLSREFATLKTSLQLLKQEQHTQHHCLETLKTKLGKLGDRVHELEDFKVASMQRLAIFKGFLRFWPAVVVTLLFAFCIGIFVDDEKVAMEIENKMELKK
jgi:hypothetical protein